MTSSNIAAPFATRERAAEIALMDEFGLPEFTELTGVGVPGLGIYRLSESGVSISPDANLGDLSAAQQHEIHSARRLLELCFPCKPEQFMEWYEATRGKSHAGKAGVSDFPLAAGFAKELSRYETKALGPSVPDDAIIAAFRVKPAEAANRKWWKYRLRDPAKCGLASGRAARGRTRIPSRWFPHIVASWLIYKRHLSREIVLRAMHQSFPEFDSDHL